MKRSLYRRFRDWWAKGWWAIIGIHLVFLGLLFFLLYQFHVDGQIPSDRWRALGRAVVHLLGVGAVLFAFVIFYVFGLGNDPPRWFRIGFDSVIYAAIGFGFYVPVILILAWVNSSF